MKILALSGSLRRASVNSALLRAAGRLAPPPIEFTLFDGLGEMPLFNPDLESKFPDAVQRLHAQVAAADALMMASPEYAHGVTGTMKNALDWLVSFEPFAGKPVAVLNASPRAHHADDSLRETLRTMAAMIVEPASITLPLLGAKLDEDGMVADAAVSAALRRSFAALRDAVGGRNGAAPTSTHGSPERFADHPVAAVMVHVADVPAAMDWYTRAFPGAQRARVTQPAFEYLLVDGVRLEFVPADDKVAAGACGSIVYWRCPDVGEALTRLASLGARLYRGPMRIEDGQLMCQVRDPWGNCIGLRGSVPFTATLDKH